MGPGEVKSIIILEFIQKRQECLQSFLLASIQQGTLDKATQGSLDTLKS